MRKSGRSRSSSSSFSWKSCLGMEHEKDSIIDGAEFYSYRPNANFMQWAERQDKFLRGSSGKDEFLGGMSFGVNSIQEASAVGEEHNGWFYLLNEDCAKRKHLRAMDQKTVLRERPPNRGKQHQQQQQQHRRNAFNNGTSSTTSSSATDTQTPAMNRGGNQPQLPPPPPPPSGDMQDSRAASSLGGSQGAAGVRTEQIKTILFRGTGAGYGFTLTGSHPVRIGRVDAASVAGRGGLRPGDIVVTVNGESVLTAACDLVVLLIRQSPTRLELGLQRCIVVDNSHLNNNTRCSTPLRRTPAPATAPAVSDASPYGYGLLTLAAPPVTHQVRELCQEAAVDVPLTLASSSAISADSGRHTRSVLAAPLNSVSSESLTSIERVRQASVAKVLRRERAFVDAMQRGLEEFAEPLRQILRPDECDALFGNMHALMELSRSCAAQIVAAGIPYCDARELGQSFVDNLGQLYKRRIYLLCDEYRRYTEGLHEHGVPVLQELRYNALFQDFLRHPSKQPDLPSFYSFLVRPFDHLRCLIQDLRVVFSCTSESHYDHLYLDDVLQCLESCCQDFPSRLDFAANAGSPAGSVSGRRSGSGASADTDSFPSSDSELQDIQSRLQFISPIKGFSLMHPKRHLVYSSELLWVDCSTHTVTKVFALLLSDMLLVTQREPDNFLTVIQEPFIFQDCTAYEFDYPDSEVRFHLCFGVYRMARFEALNREQRLVWKNLLTQRVTACRTASLTTSSIVDYI